MIYTLDLIVDGINARKELLQTTNQQIADASGVSKSTVDRILRKQECYIPNAQNLLDIANTVGYDFAAPDDRPVSTDDAALTQLIAVYEKRCEDLARESRLKTVQSNLVIAEKDKWIRFLAILSLSFVAAIILLLLYDVTRPDIGWVRR